MYKKRDIERKNQKCKFLFKFLIELAKKIFYTFCREDNFKKTD